MAASDHLQPEQLALFMSATDLKNIINVSYDRHPVVETDGDKISRRRESLDEMWARKVEESKSDSPFVHGSRVHRSLRYEGYSSDAPPIELVHQTTGSKRLSDGHHRVAAAADIEASMGRNVFIPLVHTEEDPTKEIWYDKKDEYEYVSTRPMTPPTKENK